MIFNMTEFQLGILKEKTSEFSPVFSTILPVLFELALLLFVYVKQKPIIF